MPLAINIAPSIAPPESREIFLNNSSDQFKPKEITVVSFHPGWVRTDMGGPNATLSSIDSATSLIKSFQHLTLNDTGKFFNYDGTLMKL